LIYGLILVFPTETAHKIIANKALSQWANTLCSYHFDYAFHTWESIRFYLFESLDTWGRIEKNNLQHFALNTVTCVGNTNLYLLYKLKDRNIRNKRVKFQNQKSDISEELYKRDLSCLKHTL
jgi:hypothetical protein